MRPRLKANFASDSQEVGPKRTGIWIFSLGDDTLGTPQKFGNWAGAMVIGWGHMYANHFGPQVGLILIKRVSIKSDLHHTPWGPMIPNLESQLDQGRRREIT